MKKIIMLISVLLLTLNGYTKNGDEKTTGKTIASLMKIQAYPKLTEGIVYIDGVESYAKIYLINQKGESTELEQKLFNNFKIVDFTNMPEGTYQLKIIQDNLEFLQTIVKN